MPKTANEKYFLCLKNSEINVQSTTAVLKRKKNFWLINSILMCAAKVLSVMISIYNLCTDKQKKLFNDLMMIIIACNFHKLCVHLIKNLNRSFFTYTK